MIPRQQLHNAHDGTEAATMSTPEPPIVDRLTPDPISEVPTSDEREPTVSPETPTVESAKTPMEAAATQAASQDAPTPARASPKRPSPLELDASVAVPPLSTHAPSSTGETPVVTAPTSPWSPITSARTPTATSSVAPTAVFSPSKPHLAGRGLPSTGAPSRPSTGPGRAPSNPSSSTQRKVSATMARAFADLSGSPDTPSSRASSSPPGAPDGFMADDILLDDDDEWVALVRNQLARMFPDFTGLQGDEGDAAGEGGEGDESEGEGEDKAPSFRDALQSMRSEIEVLRGIVGELRGQGAAPERPDQDVPAVNSRDGPLDADTVRRALDVVRVLDASSSSGSARADSEIFATSNLDRLLALASTVPVAPFSPPTTSEPTVSELVAFASDFEPTAPQSEPDRFPNGHHHFGTHGHGRLDAHEEIEKAHDVAVKPTIGTPPEHKEDQCFADELSHEELEEVAELAEEAHGLVS